MVVAVGALCCGGFALAMAGVAVFVVMRKKNSEQTDAAAGPESGGATLGEIEAMDDHTASDAPPAPSLPAQADEAETTSPMDSPAPEAPAEDALPPRRTAQTIIAFDDDFEDEDDD